MANIVQRHFHILTDDEEIGGAFNHRPIIAWKCSTNIRDIVVRARLPKAAPDIVGTFPCGHGSCKTCAYTSDERTITGPNGYFTINRQFSCRTRNSIYAIHCRKCGQIYVGETGRKLSKRFGEHRRDVEKHDTVPPHKRKPVQAHFGAADHCIEDMCVSILYCVPDEATRKQHEQRMIFRLGTWLGHGMNIDFDYLSLVVGNI